MQNNSLGEILRSLRKQAGLSQEELADGICSPVSVSRIENGLQMPSGTVLEGLLNKLGAGTYQICNIYYKNEKQQAFEEKAEHVAKLISGGNLSEAKEQLILLADSAKESNTNEQLYLLLDASIKLYEQTIPAEILETLKRALALTKPSMNYSDFRNTLLSIHEANILNVIVVALIKLDRTIEAIHLGEELMTALKKHKSGLKEYQVIKINLAFNLAQCMEIEKRYKEALMYSELAEELSINSPEQMLLPEIEFIKAKVYHLLGNDEECSRILKAVVPYMELIKKNSFAELVRNYALKELQLAI